MFCFGGLLKAARGRKKLLLVKPSEIYLQCCVGSQIYLKTSEIRLLAQISSSISNFGFNF